MIVLGIDPGPTHSGWVSWDTDAQSVVNSGKAMSNDDLRPLTADEQVGIVVIERPVMMGQCNMSADVLNTAVEAGRFYESAQKARFITRNEVKQHLLGWTSRKGHNADACIRQVILERFPGGIGNKKTPGPLYGISSHAWQALAVTLTFQDKYLSLEG